MSTYLIGDIQGCWQSLQQLLSEINYDANKDQLGFVGDLVNRGPDSLSVLRFIHALKDPLVVLGNHDIYAIILHHEVMARTQYKHTLDGLLDADDACVLLDWLQQQPLMITLPKHQLVMVHAGIAPQWTLAEAQDKADEFSSFIKTTEASSFLKVCFGDEPDIWSDDLCGNERMRYLVNAFTRMRFCDKQGTLDFSESSAAHPSPNRMQPWFAHRHNDTLDIAFGHWASLQQTRPRPHCFALDSGCVWGACLTALRLEDRELITVPAVGKNRELL